MDQNTVNTGNEQQIKSFLSFRPLLMALKKNIAEGNPGMKKLYGKVVSAFESHPELMETITDLSVLEPYSELIEELLSAVFPPTTANYMYGVSIPFRYEAVYVSPSFRRNLLIPGTNKINIPSGSIGISLQLELLHYTCGLILKKYLGYNNPESTRAIYSLKDPGTGNLRYMELRLDGRFIDVNPENELPELPTSLMDEHNKRLLTIDELLEKIPLNKFIFEGITPIRVNDVTETAVIGEIKNKLLDFNSVQDPNAIVDLENHIQTLIDLKDITIGITPFFKINNHYIYSDLHNDNSLLFRQLESVQEKDEISDYCKLLFRDSDQPLLFDKLDPETIKDVQCLQHYYNEGARSIIICPLRLHHELIGLLEIVSKEEGYLKTEHAIKIQPAIPLFTLGMEKTLDLLNSNVDAVIKKKFTAVQPAVEWRFTEAALNFIVQKQRSDDAKIEKIAFDDVHPLYAAIDIRGSSTSRAHAIQLDTLEQLDAVKQVVIKAQEKIQFPLLQEIEFKINRFINAASDVLQAEEELSIQDFLCHQVASVFKHLSSTEPALKVEIEKYYSKLDPALGMLYHHRKEYEQSVSRINDVLARFIDKEQAAVQKVYPHYFERYVTDGLDFNIFIGQSITPRKKFDEIYLRNMKMWQLTVLAKATKITHELEKDLNHVLRTTQLILSHNQPLSITFRTAERKFDVDGAYNTRYEIVKKRIDKVRIKETNERLTQPGKIAIVYSQAKDAEEYSEYIEFLQNNGLLLPGIENHDLEELQGVAGLKALRVDVNLENKPKPSSTTVELSDTTTDHLLKG